jgi:hypothetical protein
MIRNTVGSLLPLDVNRCNTGDRSASKLTQSGSEDLYTAVILIRLTSNHKSQIKRTYGTETLLTHMTV